MVSARILIRYRAVFWVGILATLMNLHVLPVMAVTPSLILLIDGDLWKWTGSDQPLKQLTNWGYNASPVISPDGRYVAYLSTATIRADQYRKGNYGFADSGPQNIWIIDPVTGAGTRVADQPAEATDASNPQGWYVTRAAPTWSPDGTRLAWTDLTCCIEPAPDKKAGSWEALAVYDLTRKAHLPMSTQMLPRSSGSANSSSSELDWGTGGIVYINNPQRDVAYLYSPDGRQLRSFPLTDCSDCRDIHWITIEHSLLLVLNRDTANMPPFLLIDPATGQDVTDSGGLAHIERYSLSAPGGMVLYQNNDDWFAQLPGQTPVKVGAAPGLQLDWISIAPNGKQAAFVRDNKLFMISDGKISEVNVGDRRSVVSVAWSAMGWRLKKQ